MAKFRSGCYKEGTMEPTGRRIPVACGVGFFLLLLMGPRTLVVAASSLAPWQQENGGRRSAVVEDAVYADLPPTVFAPSGRLVALERVIPKVRQPIDASNALVVALHCDQGVVVVASVPSSPYLFDPITDASTTTNQTVPGPLWILDDDDGDQIDHNDTSAVKEKAVKPSSYSPLAYVPTAPFCRLGPRIFGITAGPAVDAQVVRSHLYDLADATRRHNQHPPGNNAPAAAAYLARRWADAAHYRTLHDHDTPLWACQPLLVGPHELWQIEPTGQFYQCRATAVGRNARTAEQILLRTLNDTLTTTIGVPPPFSSGTNDDDDAAIATASRGTERSRLHATIRDLTVEQALVLATKTILEALPTKSDNAAAIRIRGLFLGERETWYTQKQLLQLIEEEEEKEDASFRSLR